MWKGVRQMKRNNKDAGCSPWKAQSGTTSESTAVSSGDGALVDTVESRQRWTAGRKKEAVMVAASRRIGR